MDLISNRVIGLDLCSVVLRTVQILPSARLFRGLVLNTAVPRGGPSYRRKRSKRSEAALGDSFPSVLLFDIWIRRVIELEES